MMESRRHRARSGWLVPCAMVGAILTSSPTRLLAADDPRVWLEKMNDALERVDEMPRVLILRLHLVTAMDATALNALESIIERFQRRGSTVVLSGLHRQPLEMLRKAGFIEVIGRTNLCAHFDAALDRARSLLDVAQPSQPEKLSENG